MTCNREKKRNWGILATEYFLHLFYTYSGKTYPQQTVFETIVIKGEMLINSYFSICHNNINSNLLIL